MLCTRCVALGHSWPGARRFGTLRVAKTICLAPCFQAERKPKATPKSGSATLPLPVPGRRWGSRMHPWRQSLG